MTVAEKLAIVEDLIVVFRWARHHPDEPAHRSWLALKEIASDLRAPLPETKTRALHALGVQVDVARRFRERVGYIEVGHMQAMAEALMAHWPAISRALAEAEEV